MKLYILDTDTLTLLLHKHPAVFEQVAARRPEELAVTIITVEEQLTGWYGRLRQAKNPTQLARAYHDLAKAVRGLAGLPILDFPEAAIARYEQLKARKLNIGKKDMCIGAIALEQGAILVSRNLRDFQRVPGLRVEDWTA